MLQRLGIGKRPFCHQHWNDGGIGSVERARPTKSGSRPPRLRVFHGSMKAFELALPPDFRKGRWERLSDAVGIDRTTAEVVIWPAVPRTPGNQGPPVHDRIPHRPCDGFSLAARASNANRLWRQASVGQSPSPGARCAGSTSASFQSAVVNQGRPLATFGFFAAITSIAPFVKTRNANFGRFRSGNGTGLA